MEEWPTSSKPGPGIQSALVHLGRKSRQPKRVNEAQRRPWGKANSSSAQWRKFGCIRLKVRLPVYLKIGCSTDMHWLDAGHFIFNARQWVIYAATKLKQMWAVPRKIAPAVRTKKNQSAPLTFYWFPPAADLWLLRGRIFSLEDERCFRVERLQRESLWPWSLEQLLSVSVRTWLISV